MLNLLCEGIELCRQRSITLSPITRRISRNWEPALYRLLPRHRAHRRTPAHGDASKRLPGDRHPRQAGRRRRTRPEHIQQLDWLAGWNTGAEKVIQINVPAADPLDVQPKMDVMDVQALEPIIDGKPLPGHRQPHSGVAGEIEPGLPSARGGQQRRL